VHLRQRVGPRWRGGSILRLRLVAYCERDGDIWQGLCSRPGMLVAASPRMKLSGLHETGASWVIRREFLSAGFLGGFEILFLLENWKNEI